MATPRKEKFASALAGASTSAGGAASASMALEGAPETAEESLAHHEVSAPGLCIECGDQPYSLSCVQCTDYFCDVCFLGTHRTGTRRLHTKVVAVSPLSAAQPARASAGGAGSAGGSSGAKGPHMEDGGKGAEEEEEGEEALGPVLAGGMPRSTSTSTTASASAAPAAGAYDITERAKYIPLRLHYEERRMLRLVEAALNVSEYVDKVDVAGVRDRGKRMQEQLKAVFAILWCVCCLLLLFLRPHPARWPPPPSLSPLPPSPHPPPPRAPPRHTSGLMVAEDYDAGRQLIEEKERDGAELFFQSAFEIARRYKILNPERMRADYGKLLYMLQDSRFTDVKELTEIECVRPIKTVHTFLAARGPRALALLKDPLVEMATKNVLANGRPRHEIDAEIKRKERAIEALAGRYSFGAPPRAQRVRHTWYRWYAWELEEEAEEEGEKRVGLGAAAAAAAAGGGSGAGRERLTAEEIRHCLYSIGDNNTFLTENVLPVEKMLGLLERHFAPGGGGASAGVSLAIRAGLDGARLTHSHGSQYTYARQSLVLWRAILKDFYRYWMAAEEDLLSTPTHPYRLRDTGQGYNRMQPCPRVARAMANVLHSVWEECGGSGNWVGSSVVHLGDTNVPNAFVFLDKYTQVSRILAPIVLVVESIPGLLRDHPALQEYVRVQFGTQEALITTILGDFFRHGFDGGGADNFFDAGSCIECVGSGAVGFFAALFPPTCFTHPRARNTPHPPFFSSPQREAHIRLGVVQQD